MSYFFRLTMNLATGSSQPELLDALKQLGVAVIQTSDGLCLKSELDLSALQKALEAKKLESTFDLASLSPSQANDEALSKDVRAFLRS